jgi:hypothetical protein
MHHIYDSEFKFGFTHFGISLNDSRQWNIKCNGVFVKILITNEALELAIYFNEDFV